MRGISHHIVSPAASEFSAAIRVERLGMLNAAWWGRRRVLMVPRREVWPLGKGVRTQRSEVPQAPSIGKGDRSCEGRAELVRDWHLGGRRYGDRWGRRGGAAVRRGRRSSRFVPQHRRRGGRSGPLERSPLVVSKPQREGSATGSACWARSETPLGWIHRARVGSPVSNHAVPCCGMHHVKKISQCAVFNAQHTKHGFRTWRGDAGELNRWLHRLPTNTRVASCS